MTICISSHIFGVTNSSFWPSDNNFKVIEQRLKKVGKLSTSSGNLALISSSVNDSSDDESDDDEDDAHIAVSTCSASVSTASSKK